MTDDLSAYLTSRPPSAERPLLGLTVLVVEDSRFACEAMRLLCLRSGARIRRADSLRSAHRHLATYRPSVVIVDLGLPDGPGAGLIAALRAMSPRPPVILGTSGMPGAEAEALAAGADGFLPKPVESLAFFQQTVLAALPPEARPAGLCPLPDDRVTPDRVALRDDLALAADLLARRVPAGAGGEESGRDESRGGGQNRDAGAGEAEGPAIAYVAQFLAGIARIAHDAPLEEAADRLRRAAPTEPGHAAGLAQVAGLVRARLAAAGPAF